MAAYAVAHLREVKFGPEIAEYLRRIDETLVPFQGRFLIHGGRAHVLEGVWHGDLIVIEFPSLARARAWYESPGYRATAMLAKRREDRTGTAAGAGTG